MPWLSILKGLMQLALIVADIVRERQLLSAGEDKHLAKDLAAMAERLGISEQLDAERDAMSIDQIKDDLKGDAR